MASFDEFTTHIDKAEGGYQATTSDTKGNTNSRGELVGTNHGISAPVYEAYIGHAPTEKEMFNMPKEQALQVYRENYWDGMIKGDQLNNQLVANAIGDMAVNGGNKGIQLAGERLWLEGHAIDLPATNHHLTDQMISALNSKDERQAALFVNAYTQDRYNFYDNLSGHTLLEHEGWDNRLMNYFPENRQLDGWQTIKEQNYYFTTENIQHIIYTNDKSETDTAKVTGVPYHSTQQALKDWQAANNLQPTGYIDPTTNFVLYHQIMDTDATKHIGDINKQLGEARDIRHELKQEAKEPFVNPFASTQSNSIWNNASIDFQNGAAASSHHPSVIYSNQNADSISHHPSVVYSNQNADSTSHHPSVTFSNDKTSPVNNQATAPSVSAHQSADRGLSDSGRSGRESDRSTDHTSSTQGHQTTSDHTSVSTGSSVSTGASVSTGVSDSGH